VAASLVGLVIRRYPRTGSAKWVLVTLADFANEHDLAWPSLATLERCCCMSRSTVARAVSVCESDGVLSVQRPPRGVRTSSRYTLNRAALAALPKLTDRLHGATSDWFDSDNLTGSATPLHRFDSDASLVAPRDPIPYDPSGTPQEREAPEALSSALQAVFTQAGKQPSARDARKLAALERTHGSEIVTEAAWEAFEVDKVRADYIAGIVRNLLADAGAS